MREKFNIYTAKRPRTRKIVGWVLVIFGFFALVTPLTPGGLLFFVGLEVLGLRFLFTDKLKSLLTRKVSRLAPEVVTDIPRENRA